MKIVWFKEKLKDNEVTIDEFGRVIIEDFELMEFITGANTELSYLEDNYACGSNGACGNAGCGNGGCSNVARCTK